MAFSAQSRQKRDNRNSHKQTQAIYESNSGSSRQRSPGETVINANTTFCMYRSMETVIACAWTDLYYAHPTMRLK